MKERIAWLHRIADALEEDRETVAQLESKDTGKPIALARRVDAARSVSNFRFFAEFGAQHSDPTFTDHGAINHLHRSPIGCVGLITPWNLPLYLLSWKTAPALAMGNTIVAKPSELTPRTASVLAEITAATRDANVSIESLIQQGRDEDGGEVLVAMVTHEGQERCVAKALNLLEGSDSLTAAPLVLPILRD